jgi:hypothetical protein
VLDYDVHTSYVRAVSLRHLPERLLQRAIHAALSEPGRVWTCANGVHLQVLSPGRINVHEGPDIISIAIYRDQTVTIGSAEVHHTASMWYAHGHGNDVRYDDVVLHIVVENDVQIAHIPWTLVIPERDVVRGLRSLQQRTQLDPTEHVDELQRAAFLRLSRNVARARAAVGRVGVVEALRVLAAEWFDRLASKRHHPLVDDMARIVREQLPESPLGMLARGIQSITTDELLRALHHAEQRRIANEGRSVRREVVINVIVPMSLARASTQQRVILLQWYWMTRAHRPYAGLDRRYPGMRQDYIWQQQGMLELQRRGG